jgi:DNA-binding protein H-NS
MAKTVADIDAQIADLQKRKTELLAREVQGVIDRIKVAIKHYGLTENDLFGRKGGSVKRSGASPNQKAAKASSRKGVTVPIKYRDEAGNAWSGRGSRPRWLVAALAEGKRLEDFEVSSRKLNEAA